MFNYNLYQILLSIFLLSSIISSLNQISGNQFMINKIWVKKQKYRFLNTHEDLISTSSNNVFNSINYVADHNEEAFLEEDNNFSRSQFLHFTPLHPIFDNIEKNLTVPIGSTAYLQCKIKHLGNRTVSWVRQRDLQILTFSNVTYTSDQRFRCIHLINTDDWTLEISHVKQKDSGIYECQISTETKLSLSIYLDVIDVKAKILEGEILHVRKDKQINLNCVINYANNSSNTLILWYHNSNLLNYNQNVHITSKLLFNEKQNAFFLHSNLRIQHADQINTGNYTCKLTTTGFTINSQASNVYVLNHNENLAKISYFNSYNKYKAIDEFNFIENNAFLVNCLIKSNYFFLILILINCLINFLFRLNF